MNNNSNRRPGPRQLPTRPAATPPVRPFRLTTRAPQEPGNRITTTVPGNPSRADRDRVTAALRELGGTAHHLDDLEAATGLERTHLAHTIDALKAAGHVATDIGQCRACTRTGLHTQLLPIK